MRKVRFLGLPLTLSDNGEEIVHAVRRCWQEEKPLLGTFVNPHAWTLRQRRAGYVPLLDKMDLVLPDGIAVARMATHLLGQKVERFSFDASSLYHPLFSALHAEKRRVFVIGAAPGVAEQAVQRMQATYPGLEVAGVLDGFQAHDEAIAAILAASPDLVVCGMGAPHQESFILALRDAGYKGASFTCGGFLDQLAIAENYYPDWVDRLEIRWLWRIYCEPARLWKRYAIEYLPFIRLSLSSLFLQKLGMDQISGINPQA